VVGHHCLAESIPGKSLACRASRSSSAARLAQRCWQTFMIEIGPLEQRTPSQTPGESLSCDTAGLTSHWCHWEIASLRKPIPVEITLVVDRDRGTTQDEVRLPVPVVGMVVPLRVEVSNVIHARLDTGPHPPACRWTHRSSCVCSGGGTRPGPSRRLGRLVARVVMQSRVTTH